MIKTLSAVAIVAVSLASPVFAQDTTVQEKSLHALHRYRGAYNQVEQKQAQDDEFNVQTHTPTNEPYFNHESYDPQRIGGRNPNFNPPG